MSRSLSSVTNEPWFLPVLILVVLFNIPPSLYVIYLIAARLKKLYDETPYSAKSYKSTSVTLTYPSRMCESSYRYKRYLTIINNMDGWCEYDFKWKYRNLNFMVEITYATTEKRPVNLLLNGQVLGIACTGTSAGWGWSNSDDDFLVESYGPFNATMLNVNTLRIESTANRFPHIKLVKVLLPRKRVGAKVTASILAHIEGEGDCQFPDGHTAVSKTTGNRLGGFAINPTFPIGIHVSLKYSVLMSGGVFTGSVSQGEFCGNRGSYLHGWRDLHVIRIWLDGADSDKYSIYYRCLVQGSPRASVWCSNGEECPHHGNSTAIVGLSILIEERGAGNLTMVDFAKDIEAPHEGYVTSDLIAKTKIRSARSDVGFVAQPSAIDSSKIQYSQIKENKFVNMLSSPRTSLLRATFSSVVYIALMAKFEDAQEDSPCAFGAFSANPKFPIGSHVSVSYSAVMSGDITCGPVSQGEFCGNRGSYIHGWRDLHVIRIWLDGADSDKYSIYYRCLVQGDLEPSAWCSNGEECPRSDNKYAILGLSVLVLAGTDHKDFMDEICSQLEEGVMSSVGLLSGTNSPYSTPSRLKRKKKKPKLNANGVLKEVKIVPDPDVTECQMVEDADAVLNTQPYLFECAMGFGENETETALALTSAHVATGTGEAIVPFYARLAYLKECLKHDVMTKKLVTRNIDSLYNGKPQMVPVSVTAYFDIKGEKTFLDGAMASSGSRRHALFAFLVQAQFPHDHQVSIKSRAEMQGGYSSSAVAPGEYCGNKSCALHGWRDLYAIRIWLEGRDCDKYSVYYKCLYRGSSEPSPWCKNGEACPHSNSVAAIEGLCVVVEENSPIEIPEDVLKQSRHGGKTGRGVSRDHSEQLERPSGNHHGTILPKLAVNSSSMKKKQNILGRSGISRVG